MGKMADSITKQMLTTVNKGTQVIKGDANSPVTTYFLSPEELEKYRAMVPPSTAKVKQTNSKIW